MKVAIIGAGTSGLSCAIELERNGMKPVIFERNGFIGEYHPHVSAFMGLLTRPAADPIAYMDKKLGIQLKPLNNFRKVIHYSPNNQLTVTGDLGYFMIRGIEEESVQGQLYRQIRSKVIFNSFVQAEDLKKEFDYVVVADGRWTTAQKHGIWKEVMQAWLMGGVFAGDFEPDTLKMWLDNELTKGVYIYLAPYGKNKAVIAHVVQNIGQEELNGYWQRFLETRDILKQYDLLESWQLPHRAGFVTTNQLENMYFIGACGGGVEPFLGFGQFNAVYTGVMAGRSIAKGMDFNRMLGKIRKKSHELNAIRPLLNAATNQDFDRLMTFMKTPGLRRLAYKTDVDVIKYLSLGINLMSSTKGGN